MNVGNEMKLNAYFSHPDEKWEEEVMRPKYTLKEEYMALDRLKVDCTAISNLGGKGSH